MNPASAGLTTESTEDTELRKNLVERALHCEMRPAAELGKLGADKYDFGAFGVLSIKKARNKLTEEQFQQRIVHQYDEEDARVVRVWKRQLPSPSGWENASHNSKPSILNESRISRASIAVAYSRAFFGII